MQFLSLKADGKPETVADARSYVLSADGKKLLVRNGNQFSIVDAKPEADLAKGRLALDRMELRIEPLREWQQMYVDAWRILRDWFYDPGLHGQDWKAIRAQYQPLVDQVRSRADLDYVFRNWSANSMPAMSMSNPATRPAPSASPVACSVPNWWPMLPVT